MQAARHGPAGGSPGGSPGTGRPARTGGRIAGRRPPGTCTGTGHRAQARPRAPARLCRVRPGGTGPAMAVVVAAVVVAAVVAAVRG
ncbi:hypothetical protein CRI70_17625 [Streptomyces sp. Ru87]|nr:hypothetical protein CRI70_17625 [Streptomyces sp. Ru87]